MSVSEISATTSIQLNGICFVALPAMETAATVTQLLWVIHSDWFLLELVSTGGIVPTLAALSVIR